MQINGTCLIFGILFLVAGIVFFVGRFHIHMKFWKNMPEEEKETIRIKPLCRNIGLMIMVCAVIFLVSGFWDVYKEHFFMWSMLAWMALCFADLFYIDKSKRYQVQEEATSQKKIRN